MITADGRRRLALAGACALVVAGGCTDRSPSRSADENVWQAWQVHAVAVDGEAVELPGRALTWEFHREAECNVPGGECRLLVADDSCNTRSREITALDDGEGMWGPYGLMTLVGCQPSEIIDAVEQFFGTAASYPAAPFSYGEAGLGMVVSSNGVDVTLVPALMWNDDFYPMHDDELEAVGGASGRVEVEVFVIGADPAGTYGAQGSKVIGWSASNTDGQASVRGWLPVGDELVLVARDPETHAPVPVDGVPAFTVEASDDSTDPLLRVLVDLRGEIATVEMGLTLREYNEMLRESLGLPPEG